MKLRAIGICLVLMGCATARVVKTEPGKGGVVAVQHGLYGDANKEAQKLMAANCKGEYDIKEEGEVVVGSTTSSRTDKEKENRKSMFNSESTQSTTRDQTEWRITYACKGKGAEKTVSIKDDGTLVQ
ncbi:MAG: hypothetical protein AB7T49_06010 [Oligoflexales bacterium]